MGMRGLQIVDSGHVLWRGSAFLSLEPPDEDSIVRRFNVGGSLNADGGSELVRS